MQRVAAPALLLQLILERLHAVLADFLALGQLFHARSQLFAVAAQRILILAEALGYQRHFAGKLLHGLVEILALEAAPGILDKIARAAHEARLFAGLPIRGGRSFGCIGLRKMFFLFSHF